MIITCKQCSYTDRREEKILRESAIITFICPRCESVENIIIKYTYKRVDSLNKKQ